MYLILEAAPTCEMNLISCCVWVFAHSDTSVIRQQFIYLTALFGGEAASEKNKEMLVLRENVCATTESQS